MARIAIVSSFVSPHVGGVESCVNWMVAALHDAGHEVRLISCAAADADADLGLPTLYFGASRYPLPYRGFAGFRRELRAADLVIAHSHRHLLALLTPFLSRGRPLFFVHTADAGTGGPFYRSLGVPLDFAARQALRRTRLIVLSRASENWIRSRFSLPVSYFPYPIAPPVAPMPNVIADTAAPTVVWVGRLSPEKDPLLAVSAIEALRSHGPPAQLDFYGDGPLRAPLAELAATRPWLHLHGARPHAEVIEAQQRSTLCLASSIADNVQVAALEALAHGLPFVGTAVGELPSYFEGEIKRFCVPPNANELAEAMLALLARYEAMRALFRANASSLVREHDRGPERLLELVDRELEGTLDETIGSPLDAVDRKSNESTTKRKASHK